MTEIKSIVKKLAQKLWQNLYLCLILLLLLDIIFGGILFLRYYLDQGKMPPTPSSLKINENLLDNVSNIFENKKIDFDEVNQNQYPDPFHN